MRTVKKYPILKEFQRRSGAYKRHCYLADTKFSEELAHKNFVAIVHSPLTLFGIEVP